MNAKDLRMTRKRLAVLVEHTQDVRANLKTDEETDPQRSLHRAMAIVYLSHAFDALECADKELEFMGGPES